MTAQTVPARRTRRQSALAVAGVAVLANFFLGWLLLRWLDDQLSSVIVYAIPASSLVAGVVLTFWGSSRRYGIAISVGTVAAVGLALLGLVLAFISGHLGE